MLKKAFAVCLLALQGCSDPSSSRLETGSKVVVFSDRSDTVMSLEVDGIPALEFIPVGTVLSAVRDSPGDDEDRKVSVLLSSGENAGKTAIVGRSSLRPAPR